MSSSAAIVWRSSPMDGGTSGGRDAANVVAGLVPASFRGHSVDELEAAVRAANWAIRDRAFAQPGLEGMGTTVCAAGLLADGSLALVNVGDSRAYLWHGGALHQLTRDHSVTADLVERGDLQEEEVADHPYYGVLTRALGVGPDVEIDRATIAVERGDRIMICSDGLFNELSSLEIANAMTGGGDVATVVDDLIDRAIAHGGRDNVSVVVAEVAAEGQPIGEPNRRTLPSGSTTAPSCWPHSVSSGICTSTPVASHSYASASESSTHR